MEEKNSVIQYKGKQISLFSDEINDYVNITDIAKAWKRRKSISSWLKNKQTLDFIEAWENKNNPDFNGSQMSAIRKMAKINQLSIKQYIEATGAIGIFTRLGSNGGTYAHKDIAIRFAGWLSPEFELYLAEEIQRLKEIERKTHSYDLLSHQQVLALTRLKEVFKYVAHQDMIENAHKEVFASQSSARNAFAEFHNWRNKMLNIQPAIINSRIEDYCKENGIALTKKLLKKPKKDKLLMLDTFETVRNAVWDFLKIKGDVNAFNLANLVGDMIRTENGEVLRKNEDNLFREKEELWGFTNFHEEIANMKEVKTARQLLEYKKR